MHDARMRLRKQLACGAGEEAWGRGRGGGEEREKREGKSRPRKKVDVLGQQDALTASILIG